MRSKNVFFIRKMMRPDGNNFEDDSIFFLPKKKLFTAIHPFMGRRLRGVIFDNVCVCVCVCVCKPRPLLDRLL